MVEILQWPAEVLKQVAQPIVEVDDKIRLCAAQMMTIMQHNSGIGLAAPQVGVPLRLIVGEGPGFRFALANPEVVKFSTQTSRYREGCLSFAGKGQVEVERPKMIKVRGITMKGTEETFKARGLLAVVLQHEIDHLDGVTLARHGLGEA